ncbi:MAG: zinc ribbon domain-containing protein, partial [Polyangia bacterium]
MTDAKTTCGKCKDEIPEGATTCPECGAPTDVPSLAPGMKTCPFCREQIRVDAVRCRHCRKDLPRSRRKTWVAAGVLCAGLLVVAGWLGYDRLVVPRTRPGCNERTLPGCIEQARKLIANGNTGRAFPYVAFAALRGSEEGSVLVSKIRSGHISNEERLTSALDKACLLDDLPSCFARALLRGGRGGVEAKAYLVRGCDGNDIAACRELGRVFEKGVWDVPKDQGKSVSLYERACTGGDMRGCFNLGISYANGKGGLGKDSKRAVELFQRACDGGDTSGCNALGLSYRDGEGGLGKDSKRAVELFQRACDGGDMLGCDALGMMCENGEGGLGKDLKRAVELFQRACDGGDVLGCNALGLSYRDGEGGLGKDSKRAVELFQRACDGGN